MECWKEAGRLKLLFLACTASQHRTLLGTKRKIWHDDGLLGDYIEIILLIENVIFLHTNCNKKLKLEYEH